MPLRRSLGDKRRELSQSDIESIVREFGSAENGETSKLFDNADFGYSRLTIERPLRLKFQISLERKELFLDGCPHLLDDIQAIDKNIGREASLDWNGVWESVKKVLKKCDSSWKASEQKFFRDVFTETCPEAKEVKSTRKGATAKYEADPKLRDFENVPLKEDIAVYFKREVLPHVLDAWIDQEKTKTGYEINFNLHFYKYKLPRPLTEIDAALKRAEEAIVRLLGEVTACV